MTELKPCPFCGGQAVLFKKTGSVSNGIETVKNKDGTYWYIGCETSDCILFACEEDGTARIFFREDSKESAIRCWNRRADNEIQQ